MCTLSLCAEIGTRTDSSAVQLTWNGNQDQQARNEAQRAVERVDGLDDCGIGVESESRAHQAVVCKEKQTMAL